MRHFVWKCAGKNAHGHVTRAILCGNLQVKCRPPRCPPRSNTGPFTLTVRTPSVWPHCLGNQSAIFTEAFPHFSIISPKRATFKGQDGHQEEKDVKLPGSGFAEKSLGEDHGRSANSMILLTMELYGAFVLYFA